MLWYSTHVSSEPKTPEVKSSQSYSPSFLQDGSRENIVVVSDAHFYGPESRAEAYELAETVNKLSEKYSIDRMISCGDLTDIHGLKVLGEELELPATFIPGDEDDYPGLRGIAESHVEDIRLGGFRENINGFEAAFAHNPRSYDEESDQDLFDTNPWENIGRRLESSGELRNRTDLDIVNHGHSHVEYPRSRGFRVENSVGSYSDPHNMSKDPEIPEGFFQIQSYGEDSLDIVSYGVEDGRPRMFQHRRFQKIDDTGLILGSTVSGSDREEDRFLQNVIERFDLPGPEESREIEESSFFEGDRVVYDPGR